MTASEFEILRADLLSLRTEVDRHFAEIEAKFDAKPNVAALYQSVAVMMFGLSAAMFGLSAAITGTVVVLKNIGVMG